jgi:hypothetical protein
MSADILSREEMLKERYQGTTVRKPGDTYTIIGVLHCGPYSRGRIQIHIVQQVAKSKPNTIL